MQTPPASSTPRVKTPLCFIRKQPTTQKPSGRST
jgi:hypothetical protein